MKNWKTTLCGVLAALPVVLPLMFPHLLTPGQSAGLTALFIAAGFKAAGDGNTPPTPTATNDSAAS